MVIWLVILAIMILIEAVTMGLTTVWFALGAGSSWCGSGNRIWRWLLAAVYCICDSLIFIYDRISSDCDAIF